MSKLAGSPETQMEWHESYRDAQKNMYRTSYEDMSMSREVHVRSDYPSGFGGHVRSVRHDILFRNTAFDKEAENLRNDDRRDAYPSFKEHIAGLPTTTRFPRGTKKPPTFGVVPHDGTTTMLKPPWATLTSNCAPLSFRNSPPTMANGQLRIGTPRVNTAAKNAGALLGPFSARGPSRGTPGSASSMKKTMNIANSVAYNQRMPTEADILYDEVDTRPSTCM
mmetsp:Transcript_24246/g.38834  ORF Transcript_24246/g.38834 Transcript_24246/m.38834 type:complete len:222 (+) Transcript_24246:63-728(+)